MICLSNSSERFLKVCSVAYFIFCYCFFVFFFPFFGDTPGGRVMLFPALHSGIIFSGAQGPYRVLENEPRSAKCFTHCTIALVPQDQFKMENCICFIIVICFCVLEMDRFFLVNDQYVLKLY